MNKFIAIFTGIILTAFTAAAIINADSESKMMGDIYSFNGTVYDHIEVVTDASFTGSDTRIVNTRAITGGRTCDMTVKYTISTDKVTSVEKRNCRNIDE